MSVAENEEYTELLARLRLWAPGRRLALADALIRSVHDEPRVKTKPRGVPANQVRGMGAGKGPLPDDDTVKQWIHEHRMEKYG
jgi:hypothetical protein